MRGTPGYTPCGCPPWAANSASRVSSALTLELQRIDPATLINPYLLPKCVYIVPEHPTLVTINIVPVRAFLYLERNKASICYSFPLQYSNDCEILGYTGNGGDMDHMLANKSWSASCCTNIVGPNSLIHVVLLALRSKAASILSLKNGPDQDCSLPRCCLTCWYLPAICVCSRFQHLVFSFSHIWKLSFSFFPNPISRFEILVHTDRFQRFHFHWCAEYGLVLFRDAA